MYVFGGLITNGGYYKLMNTIERINLDEAIIWELIQPSDTELLPQTNAGLISLNDNEILILGGVNSCEVTVYNTANESSETKGTFKTIN